MVLIFTFLDGRRETDGIAELCITALLKVMPEHGATNPDQF